MSEVVLFEIDGQVYGFDIAYVESIEKPEATTRVPGCPHFVRGLMNLRGVITPVIDGRKYFGKNGFSNEQPGRTIVLCEDDIRVGFMVDGTRNVINVDDSDIQPVPQDMRQNERVVYHGVVYAQGKAIGLIDVQPVLNSSSVAV